MPLTIQEKLARLHNRSTLYEIAATHLDGRKFLVCYSYKSGNGMARALTHTLKAGDTRLERLALATNTTPVSWEWAGTAKGKSGEWSLGFSGRTQREAICSGELASINNHTPQVPLQTPLEVSEAQWESLVAIGQSNPNGLQAAIAEIRSEMAVQS